MTRTMATLPPSHCSIELAVIPATTDTINGDRAILNKLLVAFGYFNRVLGVQFLSPFWARVKHHNIVRFNHVTINKPANKAAGHVSAANKSDRLIHATRSLF